MHVVMRHRYDIATMSYATLEDKRALDHIASHSEPKTFKCAVCPKVLTWKLLLIPVHSHCFMFLGFQNKTQIEG